MHVRTLAPLTLAASLAAASFAVTGCAGSSGGGTFQSYPGGVLGSACTIEGQAGCGYDVDHAVTEQCVGGVWTLAQACSGGQFCAIDAAGAASCMDVPTGGGGGTLDAGANDGQGGAQDAAVGGAETTDTGASTGGASDTGGSGSVVDAGSTNQPPATMGLGSFIAAVDGINVAIDYAGTAATAQLVHRQSNDATAGCVTMAELSFAQPDGSCRLALGFAIGQAGKPLNLVKAQFFVKHATVAGQITPPPCANWPEESASGTVVYDAVGPEASVAIGTIPQPGASSPQTELLGQIVAVQAAKPLLMKFGNRQFTMTLKGIGVSGTIASAGDPNAVCGQKALPLPQWQLADINPGSAGFGKTYGLEAFAGKKVVVALVSDWCNSCLAQAQLMQTLQDQAVSSGHNDVQLVLIADKQKTKPANLIAKVKNIPVFQDTAGANAWVKMNAAHAGKFSGSQIRNSGYGYSKLGKEIMYFAPSGTGSLNLTAFQNAVLKVINAPDE